MTDSTAKRVDAAAQLIEQVKSYVLLERKYITIDASEKATKLLSWLLLTVILIGVGLLVFTLILMTLIHLLASAFGNITLAYGLVALLCLCVFLFIWFKKDVLIVQPVTRVIKSVLSSNPDSELNPDEVSALAQLPDDKDELRHSIRQKEQEMKLSYTKLIERRPKKEQSLGERIGLYIDQGMTFYKVATFSMAFINMIRGKSTPAAKKIKKK